MYPASERQHAQVDETHAQAEPRFIAALGMLGRHPSAAILRALAGGPLRFNEVLAAVADVREGAVSAALRELDTDGLVRRHVDAGPPLRVLYRLTALGMELAPALCALGDWAKRAL